MPILSVQVDAPDEDGDIPVTMTLFMCCPAHTGKILALITHTLSTVFGEDDPTIMALLIHNSIREEVYAAIRASELQDCPNPDSDHLK